MMMPWNKTLKLTVLWCGLCLCAGAENPRISACSRKWVKMNDKNYQKALDYYNDCIGLGLILEPSARQKYHNNVMMNMKKTCNYFFDRSNLPTADLIDVVRKVARILEGVDDNKSLEQSSKDALYNEAKKWVPKCAQSNNDPLNDNCQNPQPTKSCLDEQDMTSPETCTDTSNTADKRLQSCRVNKIVRLLLWLLFWLLAITVIIQVMFILWLCCTSSCFCCIKRQCTCEDHEEERIGPTQRNAEVYHMIRTQEELSSMSSDDVGSDSEFEVLLTKSSLPKTKNRPFFPKFPE